VGYCVEVIVSIDQGKKPMQRAPAPSL